MKKLFLVGICVPIVIGMLSACNSNKDNGKEQSINDSLVVDTTLVDTTTTQSSANAGYDASLALLKDIEVDSVTFKQIYKNCRTKGDEFSDSKFLFDRSSPQYVNMNGIFCYLNETSPGLRFCVQYYAEDWLFIKTMTFNVDGENFEYSPDFKTDNGDGGHIWEWADQLVTDDELPMLIKLATGKKAKVKLIGAQYYDIKTITPKQQQAIKRMLMVYKGVLMGFNA
jgi:hypothetical protein